MVEEQSDASFWDRYWTQRFRADVASGSAPPVPGSMSWKRETISRFIDPEKSVLDAGCGDTAFWNGEFPADYVGVDFGSDLIERHKETRPDLTWLCRDLGDLSVELPRCHDAVLFSVLFHVPFEVGGARVVYNVARSVERRLAIYSWHENPFETRRRGLREALAKGDVKGLWRVRKWNGVSDGTYQYFHPPDSWTWATEAAGLRCIAFEKDPHSRFGGIWVFERDAQ